MEAIGLSISLGYLALTVLQVIETNFRFWNGVTNIDARLDRLFSRLLSERSKLKTWATQWREAGDPLALQARVVLQSEGDSVYHLLEKLQSYMQTAEKKYVKITNSSLRSDSKFLQFAAKSKFVLRGYDDLGDVIKTMKSINEALYNIAPPPPPYVQDLRAELEQPYRMIWPEASESQDNRTGPPGLTIRGDVFMDEQVFHSSVTQSAIALNIGGNLHITPDSAKKTTHTQPARELQVSQPKVDKNDEQSQAPNQADIGLQSQTPLEPSSYLHEIFLLCLECLTICSQQAEAGRIHAQAAAPRLKLWGSGLFEKPTSLDVLLNNATEHRGALREAFVKHMVIILSHLEIPLREMLSTTHSNNISIILLLAKLEVALRVEEAQKHIIKRWEIFLFDDENDRSVTLANADGDQTIVSRRDSSEHDRLDMRQPLGSNLQRSSVLSASELFSPASTTHGTRKSIWKHLAAVGNVIEDLFQMLPIIAILRQSHWGCVRNEFVAESTVPAIVRVDQTVSLPNQVSVLEKEDLNTVQSYIRDHDRRAQYQRSEKKLYEPLLKKELKRLDDKKPALGAQRQAEIDAQVKKLLACLAQDIDAQVLRPVPNRSSTNSKQSLKLSADKTSANNHIHDANEIDQVLDDFIQSFHQISTNELTEIEN